MRTKPPKGLVSLLAGSIIATGSIAASAASAAASAHHTQASTVKIALISSDVNTDHSWGSAHALGAQLAAQKTKASLRIIESIVNPSDFETQASALGSAGYKAVAIANGSVGDSVAKIAPQYPNTFFCEIATTIPKMPKNVCTYNVDFSSWTFVAGGGCPDRRGTWAAIPA